MVKKIIAVFKTHFDIGFTKLYDELMQEYSGEMLKNVLNTCESTQKYGPSLEYKWTMSAWPLLKTLEMAAPDDLERAEKLIRRGQLLCHALPYTTHTEFLGAEEMDRLLSFSRKFCDRYSLPYPVSAKMTDVPGHTIALPSLLAEGGIKFLHLGCNSGSCPPDVPFLFWWEGLDGRRVLTMYSKGGYGTSLLPDEDWPYPVWLALLQTNDNLGAHNADIIETLLQQVKEYDSNVELVVGTMDDFYREISAYDLSSLPVVKKDLADSWIHGIASYPKEVAQLRRNRQKLAAAEKLACLREMYDGQKVSQKEIEDIYEIALLYGEHTMGLNTIVELGYQRAYDKKTFREMKSYPNHVRMEKSWQEQRDRAEFVCSETDKLVANLGGAGVKVTAFNPNATEYDGEIEYNGGTLRVKIPPFTGYSYSKNDFKAQTESVEETEQTYRISDGKIYAEIDKKRGDLVGFGLSGGPNLITEGGIFQYDVCGMEDISHYLRVYPYYYYDWVVTAMGRQSYPEKLRHHTYYNKAIKIETIPCGVRVITVPENSESYGKYGNAKEVVFEYKIHAGRLSVRVAVNEKEESPVIEGMHVNFAFNFKNPRYRINKVRTLVDPARDLPDGANHSHYCLENFVDITEKSNGVRIISKDVPLFSLGEQQIYRFEEKYHRPQKPQILFNLCNNMWGTNFPQWMGGSYSFEFDLIPIANKKDVAAQTFSVCNPPLLLEGDVECSFPLKIKNAVLSGIRHTSDGIVLHIREEQGKHQKVQIAAEGYRLREIDGMGRRGNIIKSTCDIEPFGIRHVLLEKEEL